MSPPAKAKEHFWMKMAGLLATFCIPTFSAGMWYVTSIEHRLTSVETKLDVMAGSAGAVKPGVNHIARATDATHEPTQETAGDAR